MSGVRRLAVDLDLLKKYARLDLLSPAARTAPHFHSGVGPSEFGQETSDANAAADASDLSLYVHLPFCPSLCAFCGCTVEVTRDAQRIADYLDDLKKEIDLLAARTRPGRRVVQMQWGGGTPTYLTTAQLRDLFGCIRGRFAFAGAAEISIEVDPRRLGADHLGTLRDLGFNRVTFGVQDLDPSVQRAIDREQSEATTRDVVGESRRLGFDSVGVDLIYGLPFQSASSFADTLQTVADIGPDRVTVFGYGHIPHLKGHQRVLEKFPLPDLDERLTLFKTTVETLTAAGYVYLGMDYFARPGDELARALDGHALCRNLQGYGTSARTDVHGVGVTAISQLQRMLAQNTRRAADYREAVRAGRMPTAAGCRLNDDDVLRGHVVRDVLCSKPIDKRAVEGRFGIDFDACFADTIGRLGEFVADGLVTLSADRIDVTEKGRPFVRTIAAAFCWRLRG